ncbi:MAG: hypothetical protein H0U75_12300 [Legionella sp.]|nr:hypothetical protein [Legionella sp.]
MYSRISGDREYVMTQTGVYNGAKKMSYRQAMGQIFKDLNRCPFIPTNGKTFNHYVQAWMHADLISDYRQGTMEAQIESMSLSNYGIQQDPPVAKANFCSAYFDDEGIPCGASLTWLSETAHVNCATGAVISNTPFEKRLMTQVVPNMLMKAQSIDVCNDLEDTLLPLLNSKELAPLLKGFKKADGSIDVEKLLDLQATVNDKSTVEAKQARFNLIKKHFDEKLLNKEIPEIEKHDSMRLQLSNKLDSVAAELGTGGIYESKQPFYKRNSNSLRLLAISILLPLSLFSFGAPFIVLALSLLVCSLFILAPSLIFLHKKEVQISSYNSAYQEFSSLEPLDDRIDKLFESICRPLLLQEADGLTDKEVRKYIDDVILGKPRPNPMCLLLGTLSKGNYPSNEVSEPKFSRFSPSSHTCEEKSNFPSNSLQP